MKAILDRFEESSAVLLIDGQELIVPRTELPKDIKEGAVVFLLVCENPSEEKAREKLAKSILNEILNNEV